MEKIRPILSVVFILAFVLSIVMLQQFQKQSEAGSDAYQKAHRIAANSRIFSFSLPVQITETILNNAEGAESQAGSSPAQDPLIIDKTASYFDDIDLAALQQTNPDVLGWIYLPGVDISYPLVQGTDNDYYLNHTWDYEENYVGSIFMECLNNADLQDFNTIIYGHNLLNGTMFTPLHNYKKETYRAEHPYIYIKTADGIYRYTIFSAYEASVVGHTFWLGIQKDETKQYYIDRSLEEAYYSTNVTPTSGDRILTLSTCTGNGHDTRWVVQGSLEGKVTAE